MKRKTFIVQRRSKRKEKHKQSHYIAKTKLFLLFLPPLQDHSAQLHFQPDQGNGEKMKINGNAVEKLEGVHFLSHIETETERKRESRRLA